MEAKKSDGANRFLCVRRDDPMIIQGCILDPLFQAEAGGFQLGSRHRHSVAGRRQVLPPGAVSRKHPPPFPCGIQP